MGTVVVERTYMVNTNGYTLVAVVAVQVHRPKSAPATHQYQNNSGHEGH